MNRTSMTRHILFFLILLTSGIVAAQEAQQQFDKGCQLYEAGSYQEAAATWEELAGNGYNVAELFYNLGNAYFRLDQMGKAALWYERASLLSPHDRELRENLELTYSKTEDQITPIPQFFAVRWWNSFFSLHSVRGWMSVCIILMILTCCGWIFFFLSHSHKIRKTSFIISLLLVGGLIISALGATFSARRASIHQDAIVIEPICVVKSSPDRGGVDRYIIHDGTKVTIEEDLDGWTLIRLADGNSGWVESDDIESI